MRQCLFMAGSAAHHDFGKSRCVAVLPGIVGFLYATGVAVGTLAVPVLVDAPPVNCNIGWIGGWIIETEPALSSRSGRTGVPGNIQCLQLTFADIEQVLLQRIYPKGIANPPVRGLSLFGQSDPIAIIVVRKQRFYFGVEIASLVEIAQYAGFGWPLHRDRMLGAGPIATLLRVAANTARSGLGIGIGHQA
ncbi:hypothetical protein [Marinobacterium aestuariivivens]